jgi:hypothetical protein
MTAACFDAANAIAYHRLCHHSRRHSMRRASRIADVEYRRGREERR